MTTITLMFKKPIDAGEDEEDDEIIWKSCPKCNIRIGSHSIMESYRCGLMTKEQARDAIKKQHEK